RFSRDWSSDVCSSDLFSKGNSKLGYHVGLFARLGGNFLYLQPEVLYTNTGGKFEERVQGVGEVKYEATFNRLDVPVLVGLKFARSDERRVGKGARSGC